MKFGPIPVEQAEGKILAHHITGMGESHAFHKGKPLKAEDIAALIQLGWRKVYAAELEPDDVDENTASRRVGMAVCGKNLSLTKVEVGRVNVQAQYLGVLRVDVAGLANLNAIRGITLATLADYSLVHDRQTVATVKIVPFAVPKSSVERAERLGQAGGYPLLSLTPLSRKSVALILTGSPAARQRVFDSFLPPLQTRVETLGSVLTTTHYIPIEGDDMGESGLAAALEKAVREGAGLILLAGETAIMDDCDVAPRAVERVGGEIACFGAPVDPGNLLMIAYLGAVPVLGAPGCARSLKQNVIDWVLPRLLAGERLERAAISAMGHGGLIETHARTFLPINDPPA